jgi:hypothetical protein
MVTEALRGSPEISASSPKPWPGCSSASVMTLPSPTLRVTRALPERIR